MNSYISDIADLENKDYKLYYSLMSESRKKRVDKLKNLNDKKSTVLGEMLVKKHFGIDSIIEYDNRGKPFLVNKDGFFSVSHSKGLVGVLVSDCQVGIDIERIRKVNLNIIKKVCTPKEKEYVQSGKDEEEKNLRLLEIWTFKEAYFKYLGTGITDFLSVDYFNDKIKRKKVITKEYIYHIVGEGFHALPKHNSPTVQYFQNF
ncbi:MAG: 4'-phosphopantetheinyl transferase superfamily protein [Ruminococcaceae bacterium]|nr:4'-phosphopantetheinyl transferase superfamily protein [Oscillospiraceae bacterium]